jgi:8-amino-7-oxononanoate synthase
MMTFERLAVELAEIERAGLKRRRLTVESAQGPRIVVDGRELLAFCSNDYLGLANHPRLIQALADGAQRYGAGAGASHLITGHGAAHARLEHALAEFAELPRALLFSTGYQANVGAITALVGREDAVFSDALNHASLIDGVRLSRAQVVRFPHADLGALERALAASQARSRLVVTDSVFSMDGDIAPLPQMLALCERYDAWLLVDDAHGFGVLGRDGRGALEHFRLRSPRLIYVGTLGKAAGVSGAFVAGEDIVIETLIQRARTYIYTTALPPAVAVALDTSLRVIREEGWRRDKLQRLIALFRQGAAAADLPLLASDTAIQPLVIGDNAGVLSLSQRLRERGILVPAIRPPTVPEGTARLRISLSAAHEEGDVRQLLEALGALGARPAARRASR